MTQELEPEATDSVVSWGRGGEIETSTGRGDLPALPAGSGFSGAGNEHIATAPQMFGTELKPDANHNQSWNMNDISTYKIGG
jgi:hypothetical protein